MKHPLVFFFIFMGCARAQTPLVRPPRAEGPRALQADLARGWNTWNNPSLLSHVLMPEAIALNLVFRNNRGGPYWLRESYIQDPSRTRDKTEVRPGLRTYDGRYTEVMLRWAGIEADVRSATDGDDIVILYAPRAKPASDRTLILETALLWNHPGHVALNGSGIEARAGGRVLAIGATLPSTGVRLPLGTPYLTFSASNAVGSFTGKPRSLEQIRAFLDTRRSHVEAEAGRFGKLADAYQAMQGAAAWNLIYDAENARVMAPVTRVWNELWGGYVIFDWDTYFTGWMMAVDDRRLAYANAMAITHSVTERGFVPNVAASRGVKSFDRSQPPVGAITCKALHDKFGERWFLEDVYPDLLRWNRFWPQARSIQGFLAWGSDPHPRGMDGFKKQAAMFESGLDNSPLFDDAVFDPGTHTLALADVGLMSLYIADCRALADIARVLGKTTDAAELDQRASQFAGKLGELWSEEKGIYLDRDLTTGKPSRHLAPTNFYPLLARVPTQAQAERMVKEHLLNPAEFAGEWMLPAIARNDPGFVDNDYWRGRIWAPMNFLVYLGLRNYDLPQARKLIAERSVALLRKEWHSDRHVHENYNATTGAGHDVPGSDSFYSWGGLLGLIGLMEAGHF